MEEEEDSPPFWLQPTDRRRRRRQQPSSLVFNSGVLVILLVLIAFAFIFVIVPSVISFTSQVFKPQLVKKGWDSLNLVLVLFAIVCGFLSRGTGNDHSNRSSYDDYKFSSTPKYHAMQRSNSLTPRQWHDYPDRTAYNSLQRLRSSSSYPDLRQESTWTAGDDRWRFYDDTQVYHNRSRSGREFEQQEEETAKIKDLGVDTFVNEVQEEPVSRTPHPPPSPPPPAPSPLPREASPSLRTPSPPPPAPTPKVRRRRPKRVYQDLAPKEKADEHERSENDDSENVRNLHQPPTTTEAAVPAPPPPPPPTFEKTNKKKRGGATKDFLISLGRKKKKKQRQKSVENLDDFFNLEPPLPYTQPLYPPPSPPPPPPPPPPFFQNIFSSKKSKTKKIHSVPPEKLEAHASKAVSQPPKATLHKPPLPAKVSSISSLNDNLPTGNESPLIPIPPPPPPPPFKIQPWKIVTHGDFVRLKSFNSSRSSSPDFDGAEDALSDELSPSDGKMDDGNSTPPSFCPSPDVDTKADDFIARFRAGLKLEKMNSVKEKQGRVRSNLGPHLGPI